MSDAEYRSPLDMLTATDVHALRRVRRLASRMLVEAKNHEGHGSSCPWANEQLVITVGFLGEECDRMVDAYEKQHGVVPNYPITTMMSRREGAPPEA